MRLPSLSDVDDEIRLVLTLRADALAASRNGDWTSAAQYLGLSCSGIGDGPYATKRFQAGSWAPGGRGYSDGSWVHAEMAQRERTAALPVHEFSITRAALNLHRDISTPKFLDDGSTLGEACDVLERELAWVPAEIHVTARAARLPPLPALDALLVAGRALAELCDLLTCTWNAGAGLFPLSVRALARLADIDERSLRNQLVKGKAGGFTTIPKPPPAAGEDSGPVLTHTRVKPGSVVVVPAIDAIEWLVTRRGFVAPRFAPGLEVGNLLDTYDKDQWPEGPALCGRLAIAAWIGVGPTPVIAARLDIEPERFSAWARGHGAFAPSTWVKLAALLNVDAAALLRAAGQVITPEGQA